MAKSDYSWHEKNSFENKDTNIESGETAELGWTTERKNLTTCRIN